MFAPHFPLCSDVFFSQAGSIARKDNLNKWSQMAGEGAARKVESSHQNGRYLKCRLIVRLPNGRQVVNCKDSSMSFPLRGLGRFWDGAILELRLHQRFRDREVSRAGFPKTQTDESHSPWRNVGRIRIRSEPC